MELRRWRWGIVNPNFGWRSKRSERLKNDRECRERERERESERWLLWPVVMGGEVKGGEEARNKNNNALSLIFFLSI
jgi:hypothetical protein